MEIDYVMSGCCFGVLIGDMVCVIIRVGSGWAFLEIWVGRTGIPPSCVRGLNIGCRVATSGKRNYLVVEHILYYECKCIYYFSITLLQFSNKC